MEKNKLRLITWIVADGTFRITKYSKVVAFKMSKPDKIADLEGLLADMKLQYSKHVCKKSGWNIRTPYQICINAKDSRKIIEKWFDGKKVFPTKFKELRMKNLQVVAKTLSETDGKRMSSHHILWNSTNLQNIKIIKEACKRNNIEFRSDCYNREERLAMNFKPVYRNRIWISEASPAV